MAGKLFAHNVWCESTQIIQVKKWQMKVHKLYKSKNGTNNQYENIKKLIHVRLKDNFCLNYLLIKTNRTALQTYKVEEQTFMDTLYSVPPS